MKKCNDIFILLMILPIHLLSQGIINNGNLIRVSNGAYLRINSGNFLNNTTASQDGKVSLSGDIYLTGDWTNSTTGAELTLTGGTVNFNGSSTQKITHGTFRTKFYNLKIANGSVVEVPAGKEVEITNDLENNGTFKLLSTGEGTAALFYNGKCEENIDVQRFIAAGGTTPIHYLSSPVKDAPLSSLDCSYNVYWYDETNTSTNLDYGWTRILSGNLVNARGYAAPYSGSSDKTITFSGTLDNTSDIGISITYNNTGTPTADGWNLIGNPYPASISANQFLTDNTNIVGAVYFWDDGDGTINRTNDYAVWNKTGGVGTAAQDMNNQGAPNGKIAIAQGFFVQALSSVSSIPGNDYVYFKNSHKTTNTSSQFFVPEFDQIQGFKLSLTNSNQDYNEILIGFSPEATLDKDRLFDAPKLQGNQHISLYSLLNFEKMAIQGLPPISDEVISIPVGYFTDVSGKHTFMVKEMENWLPSVQVFLEDLKENIRVKMDTSTVYGFNSEKGCYDNRFLLHFIPENSGIQSLPINPFIEIIYHHGLLTLVSNCQNNYLQMFDLNGKLILNKPVKDPTIPIEINVSKGCYIVRLLTENGCYDKLIMVSQ